MDRRMFLKTIILINVALSAYSFNLDNNFVFKNISTRIVNELKNVKISTGLDLYDGSVINGVSSKVAYEYKMEPSFLPNKFLRLDKWVVHNEIRVGDILDGILPFRLNIEKDSSIYFIRNFDSQKQAATAIPYSVNKIPYDSKSTIERLNVGDFFSYPAKLNINTGTGAARAITPYTLTANITALMSGKFTINIFKVSENSVRLKLVAQTEKTIEGRIETESDFNLTGIAFIDHKIDKVLAVDLIDVFAQKSHGEQYILDYLFDLSNPEAAKAFDEIISPKKRLDLKDLITKFSGIEYFEDKLISDYSMAEKLHFKGNGVQRVFKGFNKFKLKKNGTKVSLLVSKIKTGKAYFKNNITIEDDLGEVSSYFFPNRIHFYDEELNLLVTKRKDEIETSYYGLVPIGRSVKQDKFSDIGLSHWRDDDFLTKNEWRYVKQEIYDFLPDELIKKIDLSQYESKRTKTNTRLKVDFLFKEAAFDYLQNTSYEELHEIMKKLVRERVVFKKTKVGSFISKTVKVARNFLGLDALSIAGFTKSFHQVITDPEYTAKERVEKLLELPDSFLFKRYGIKLLLTLLPQKYWVDYIYFDFEILGTDLKPVKYTLGELEQSEIFKQILQINKEFYAPANDMRIMVQRN